MIYLDYNATTPLAPEVEEAMKLEAAVADTNDWHSTCTRSRGSNETLRKKRPGGG